MDPLDKKLEGLINTSLFLDKKRKDRLLKVLKKADKRAKEYLALIFEKEKKNLGRTMIDFIKSKNSTFELDMIFTEGERIVRNEIEKASRSGENTQTDKLLSLLE